MSTEASSKAAAAAGGAAAGQDGRALPAGDGEAGVAVVLEPCVIAVDDSSVDRALVAALLRRSKYRGQAAGFIQFAFCSVSLHAWRDKNKNKVYGFH